jgi:ribokinase
MKYDFITIGGATLDISFYTQEGILLDNKKDLLRQKLLAFEYGAKIKIERTYYSFGGGASNTAVNFSRLGFKAAAFTCLGKDEQGTKIIENFRKQGVGLKLIQSTKEEETGFSFIVIGPRNEHVVFSNRGASNYLQVRDSDLIKLSKTKYLYLTSLSGEWANLLEKIFNIEGPKVIWNPGHSQIVAGYKVIGKYLKKTHILCVNKDEAIELILSIDKYKNKPKSFFQKLKNLLVALSECGPHLVIITSGYNGADCFDGTCFYHQDIIKEERKVDTTGVGDAFHSSFVAGLEIYNGDIEDAMYLGVRASASVISERGAQNGLLKKDLL